MSRHSTVVIIDYGSQYTQLIARRVREFGIYSRVLPATTNLERIRELSPRAVILSGGPSSVYDDGAPKLPPGFLDWIAEQMQQPKPVKVLGICYGMQLLVQALGGQVAGAKVREYGRTRVIPEPGTEIFRELENDMSATSVAQGFFAWMSHGDETKRMPEGFKLVAKSSSGSVAAIENIEAGIFALQFHPEVTHTEGGKSILRHFLTGIAEIQPDWDMGSVCEEQVEKIRELVGPTEHVICALSGGVDSAVAATLVHQAIGARLHCVFVDNGLLRFQERERVMKMFKEQLHLPVRCVDAADRFLSKLAGVTDPEQKRKIIGSEFISVFEEAANEIAQKTRQLPGYLVQGTLYPDVIESSPPPGKAGACGDGHTHSATIKSHHNVGGLPENLRFQLLEPLRDLFKDEVRELGRKLGVPENFLMRHPFPGPGLAVRVIGEITTERLEILRRVDEIFIECIREAGLYSQIWQAFAVFLPIKSVGVQGDGRTHDHVVALRAVTSHDGMTADWFPFDAQFLGEVSARICNEVKNVNRVVYDISSKPPATIEWE